MANEQPQKNDNASSGGGGGKPNNRRYFRRRRKGSGSASSGEGQAAPAQGKEQNRPQADAKSQGSRSPEQRNEQQEKRRKRRRSNSNSNNSNSGGSGGNNRRSSSSRRQRRQEQADATPSVVPELEQYQEPVDVFVHTHIVRPAYRDASSDYISETSFLSGRHPAETSIHMERLEEDIRKQLDEYLNRPVTPVKVIFEIGDEGWDEDEDG